MGTWGWCLLLAGSLEGGQGRAAAPLSSCIQTLLEAGNIEDVMQPFGQQGEPAGCSQALSWVNPCGRDLFKCRNWAGWPETPPCSPWS